MRDEPRCNLGNLAATRAEHVRTKARDDFAYLQVALEHCVM
jgi:hypothetical protein